MNISQYFENTDELFGEIEDMTLESIQAIMENASDFLRANFEHDLDEYLNTDITYPRYGYDTAQVIENEDEYRTHLQSDFNEQLVEWLDTASQYQESNQ